MRLINYLLVASTLLFAPAVHAEKITIAAAADLKYAMSDIVKAFKKTHPSDEVEVVFGSSGTFFNQLQHGAPFDLYFSADIGYPRELVKHGLAASDVRPYALGRIVLWSSSMDATKLTMDRLADDKITRLAIANPKHAPYGKRAEEALRATGLWDKVQRKLVYGENVAQTAQFVWTGNAEVGIIALSLALSPDIASKGGYWLIPDNLHKPLEQGYVLTKRAARNQLAQQFADYMASPPTRAIMTKYGFVLPSDTVGK